MTLTTTTTAAIPAPATTALPRVYPISALLALSSAPAALSDAQLDSLRTVAALVPAVSRTPRVAAPKPSKDEHPTQNQNQNKTKDAAPRRRRVGRARKNTLTQTKTATKAVDVQARRAARTNGQAHGGHGTWGWNQYTTPEALASHQHDLEESWRHAPVIAITAA